MIRILVLHLSVFFVASAFEAKCDGGSNRCFALTEEVIMVFRFPLIKKTFFIVHSRN